MAPWNGPNDTSSLINDGLFHRFDDKNNKYRKMYSRIGVNERPPWIYRSDFAIESLVQAIVLLDHGETHRHTYTKSQLITLSTYTFSFTEWPDVRSLKAKFHGSSFLVTSSYSMSVTCH